MKEKMIVSTIFFMRSYLIFRNYIQKRKIFDIYKRFPKMSIIINK